MLSSDRTSIRQRIVDMFAAIVLAITSGGMLTEWILNGSERNPLGHVLYGVWAVLLVASSLAAGVGAALRTTIPSRRLSAGFGLELTGWGVTGFLVFWYAVFDYRTEGDWKLAGTLLALTILLLGNWLRLVSAMRQAKRQDL